MYKLHTVVRSRGQETRSQSAVVDTREQAMAELVSQQMAYLKIAKFKVSFGYNSANGGFIAICKTKDKRTRLEFGAVYIHDAPKTQAVKDAMARTASNLAEDKRINDVLREAGITTPGNWKRALDALDARQDALDTIEPAPFNPVTGVQSK